ncbi:MAG: CPBP family intramembrane metalloprotease [Lachnospiraceae bacterium]|nr:CPBP family intramembrane metalloprotease [Lachnospiraceae bacterium]
MERRFVKKTNALFLGLILFYLGLEFLITLISARNIELGLITSLILSQGALLLPALVFTVVNRLNVKEWVPFKKIRWSTFGLTLLFTVCISPFAVWLNILSQLFTDNIIADLADELLAGPPAVLLLIIGIVGPFCEELTFRGLIFHGLRRSGRVLSVIFISGLWFGLMHMNLNQFSYAFVLGVAFAFLTEATGSLIPSLTVHLCINSFNIGIEYLADFAYSTIDGNEGGLAQVIGETEITQNEVLMMAGVYMIPALLGLALSIVVFIAICKREGSLERMRALFTRKQLPAEEQPEELQSGADGDGPKPADIMPEGGLQKNSRLPVITATGYIAMGLCLITMLATEFLMGIL